MSLRMEDRLTDIAFESVSASLYRTYTVQVTAMLGDMEIFFTYMGVIGRDDDIRIPILSIHFKQPIIRYTTKLTFNK